MADSSQPTKSSVIPALRYRNAPEAMEWLCRVFGFTKHAVYEGPNGTIAHAELTLDAGMLMLGSLPPQENQVDGPKLQTIYLVVADADEAYGRVQNAGAEIVSAIKDQPYGSREFTCWDLEGHVWSVGTYDPWQQPSSAS